MYAIYFSIQCFTFLSALNYYHFHVKWFMLSTINRNWVHGMGLEMPIGDWEGGMGLGLIIDKWVGGRNCGIAQMKRMSNLECVRGLSSLV